jgi:hypothetical protein
VADKGGKITENRESALPVDHGLYLLPHLGGHVRPGTASAMGEVDARRTTLEYV